jgi:hypothetical protein
MTTATATKTGWFIRKARNNEAGYPADARSYFPVYIFADGAAKEFRSGLVSIEECREIIRDHFDGGRKAPARPGPRPTAEEMADTLWRACLSDPF